MTNKTEHTVIVHVARKSVPVRAFEETPEGNALWNKIVRPFRTLDSRHVLDMKTQLDAAIFVAASTPGVVEIWVQHDSRSNIMVGVHKTHEAAKLGFQLR